MRGLNDAELAVMRIMRPAGSGCGFTRQTSPDERPMFRRLVMAGRCVLYACECGGRHYRITPAGRTALACELAVRGSFEVTL